MSLAKIPLVFCVSLAFKKCVTPPHPAPSKSETLSGNRLNTNWFCQDLPRYGSYIQLFAGFAEIAMIVAAHNPASQISQSILAGLLFTGGDAASLRISPVNFLGGMMMIIGTLIRMLTFRYLGKFFRFVASIQKDHQLITGGPYAIVRHPGYTGLLFSHTGWFLWNFGDGSWVRESGLWGTVLGKVGVLAFAGLVILGALYLTLGRMSSEDRALRERFGVEWDRWAVKVRYMVIPGVYVDAGIWQEWACKCDIHRFKHDIQV